MAGEASQYQGSVGSVRRSSTMASRCPQQRAMTSRLAQLAIIDVLIACLSLADYERAVKTTRHTVETLSLKRY